MFKEALFDTLAFLKKHRRAVYHCLKEVPKPFRHASAFKTRVSQSPDLPLPHGLAPSETMV